MVWVEVVTPDPQTGSGTGRCSVFKEDIPAKSINMVLMQYIWKTARGDVIIDEALKLKFMVVNNAVLLHSSLPHSNGLEISEEDAWDFVKSIYDSGESSRSRDDR